MSRWRPMKFYMELKHDIVREYDNRIEHDANKGGIPKAIPGKELEAIFNSMFLRLLERIEEEETR